MGFTFSRAMLLALFHFVVTRPNGRVRLNSWHKHCKYLYCFFFQGADLVPEPAVTIAAFKAMRRLNEFPMTIRWLECIRASITRSHQNLFKSI